MKNKILILIIIVLILICAIALVIVFKDKLFNAAETSNSGQDSNTNSNAQITEIETADGKITISKDYNFSGNKDIVYTFLISTITESNSDGVNECKYMIPQFNIESTNIQKINMEILDMYQVEVEDYIKDNKELNEKMESMDYLYYENDNIISLIFNVYNKDGDYSQASVYNIDKTSGETIENDKILEIVNIKETELREKIANSIENSDEYKSTSKNVNTAIASNKMLKTKVKYENMPIEDIEMYIDDNNELGVCIDIYSVSQDEVIPEFFNISEQIEKNDTLKAINTEAEMLNKINDVLLELQTTNDLGEYAQSSKCYYYTSNDVLSIVVECPTASETYYKYFVYNIELSTGKDLTNRELINKISVTENKIKGYIEDGINKLSLYNVNGDIVKNLKQSILNGENTNFSSVDEIDTYVKEQMEKTLNKYDIINLDELKLYLNNSGNISAVLEVFDVSGENMRTVILDLKTLDSVYSIS